MTDFETKYPLIDEFGELRPWLKRLPAMSDDDLHILGINWFTVLGKVPMYDRRYRYGIGQLLDAIQDQRDALKSAPDAKKEPT